MLNTYTSYLAHYWHHDIKNVPPIILFACPSQFEICWNFWYKFINSVSRLPYQDNWQPYAKLNLESISTSEEEAAIYLARQLTHTRTKRKVSISFVWFLQKTNSGLESSDCCSLSGFGGKAIYRDCTLVYFNLRWSGDYKVSIRSHLLFCTEKKINNY